MQHRFPILNPYCTGLPTDTCRPVKGFTLIELSIVLVIIGLLIGGIMVGRDLIRAQEIRSQISQIEKYKSAVNTFKLKYNNIPGDMPPTDAAAFGFATRAGSAGRGDGNGLLEGSETGSTNLCGETALFWNDLVTANLIGDSVVTAASSTIFQGDTDGDINHCPAPNSTNTSAAPYLPATKITSGSFVTVYSNGTYNYYLIIGNACVASQGNGFCYGGTVFWPGITPQNSYMIDIKIDDGYPNTGTVASTNTALGATTIPTAGAAGTAAAGDCGDTDTSPTSYNVGPSYANMLVCAINFRF